MAITPATYNIRPQRRADYPLSVAFKDSAGAPIDISGWEVLAQVWDKCRTTMLGEFDVTVTDAEAGEVELVLSHTTTAVLPAEARYDVMLINPSGLREYYIEGIVRPSQGFSAPS